MGNSLAKFVKLASTHIPAHVEFKIAGTFAGQEAEVRRDPTFQQAESNFRESRLAFFAALAREPVDRGQIDTAAAWMARDAASCMVAAGNVITRSGNEMLHRMISEQRQPLQVQLVVPGGLQIQQADRPDVEVVDPASGKVVRFTRKAKQ